MKTSMAMIIKRMILSFIFLFALNMASGQNNTVKEELNPNIYLLGKSYKEVVKFYSDRNWNFETGYTKDGKNELTILLDKNAQMNMWRVVLYFDKNDECYAVVFWDMRDGGLWWIYESIAHHFTLVSKNTISKQTIWKHYCEVNKCYYFVLEYFNQNLPFNTKVGFAYTLVHPSLVITP